MIPCTDAQCALKSRNTPIACSTRHRSPRERRVSTLAQATASSRFARLTASVLRYACCLPMSQRPCFNMPGPSQFNAGRDRCTFLQCSPEALNDIPGQSIDVVTTRAVLSGPITCCESTADRLTAPGGDGPSQRGFVLVVLWKMNPQCLRTAFSPTQCSLDDTCCLSPME
jgi:hypothetical protein